LPLEERSDEEEEGFDDFITFSSLDYLRICQESRNTYHKKLVWDSTLHFFSCLMYNFFFEYNSQGIILLSRIYWDFELGGQRVAERS